MEQTMQNGIRLRDSDIKGLMSAGTDRLQIPREVCIMEIKSVGMGYAGMSNVTSSAPLSQDRVEEPDVTAAQETTAQSAQEVKKPQTESGKDGKDGEKDSASEEQIKQAISEINKRARDSEAVFGIHEKTNRVTIKIVDKKTKDVIKEVPAEKTLDLIAKAWELAGLLVDEKR